MASISELKKRLAEKSGGLESVPGSGSGALKPPVGTRKPPTLPPPSIPTSRTPPNQPARHAQKPLVPSSAARPKPPVPSTNASSRNSNLSSPSLPSSPRTSTSSLPPTLPPPLPPSQKSSPSGRSPMHSARNSAPSLPKSVASRNQVPPSPTRSASSIDADDIYELEDEDVMGHSSPEQIQVNGGTSLPFRGNQSSGSSIISLQGDYRQELDAIHMQETRNVTRSAGFGSHLQNRVAHEDLLRLTTEEAKLVGELKKLVISRAKAEKDYATALHNISLTATKFESELLQQSGSLVYQAWRSIVEETREVGALVHRRADLMNTALREKVDQLIQEKSKAKSQYVSERHKIDEDFKKSKLDMRDCDQKYQRASKTAREAKQAYNDALIKAKNTKDIESRKEKYQKCVKKQHESHNDYILSLRAASTHQEHYSKVILPRLLNCLQQTQESHVVLLKHIFSELSTAVNTASGDFIDCHNRVIQSVNDIRIDLEYANYIENNKVDPDQLEAIEFDTTGFNELSDNLVENELVLNNLTFETMQHTLSSHSDELGQLETTINQKEDDLRALDEEIRQIPQESKTETAVLDLLTKQKDYRDQSREVLNLKCQEAKISEQFSAVQAQLDGVEPDHLPPGLDLPDQPSPQPVLNTIKSDPGTGTSGKSGWKLSTLLKTKPSSNRDVPLEEEPWYHGALPRQETEDLLKQEGDFIVRFKSDASGQYVLSCRSAEKLRHFPIVQQEDQTYRLEGGSFNSIQELINHHMSTITPVTRASNAVIRNPVCKVRDAHDLRHEDIILGRKLGAGHFGDVHEGTMGKQAVAVKTCKATVDAATRRKFLSEANILKNYNHPNIVKLIGVATDKHPIYIVMELVPGGDLLKLLRDDTKHLNHLDRVKMAEDAASGMAYLESKNCIHRDLAARNCLVGAKNILKISDFGMSREEEEYQIESNNMRQIPIKWTAPEAMNYGRYTSLSDVWSYGILLYEIFSRGSTPYAGMNNNEAREKIEAGYRMTPPADCPPGVGDWMEACWRKEPDDRPRFADIKVAMKKIHKMLK